MTDRQITRRLGSGAWIPVRRGIMQLSADAATRDPLIPGGSRVVPASEPYQEAWRISAFLIASRSRELVASHASAAYLHGLPRPLDGWGMTVATSVQGVGRNRNGSRVFVVPLPDDDVTTCQGLSATSLARTVADCLRTMKPVDGLAIADAAMARGLIADELSAVLDRQAGWPGIVRAREVAGLASGRRETPLESWSAWTFHVAGLPAPTWQVNILTCSGIWCGRVDSWWAEGLAGESDGRAKYRLAAAERSGTEGERLAEVLDAEREREQAIRRTGAELIRWGARDVLQPRPAKHLTTYLAHTLASLRRSSPFSGISRPA